MLLIARNVFVSYVKVTSGGFFIYEQCVYKKQQHFNQISFVKHSIYPTITPSKKNQLKSTVMFASSIHTGEDIYELSSIKKRLHRHVAT